MSMSTWHNYGYGINTDKIDTTADKLRAYIDNHPKLKENILSYIIDSEGFDDNDTNRAEETYKTYSLDELIELFSNYSDFGEQLNGIIHLGIEEEINIPLVSCSDSDSEDRFVIMPSYYPWEVIGNEMLMSIESEDDIKKIFAENIKILTDQTLEELDWGEQSIEGWG